MDNKQEKQIFLEGPKTFGSPYSFARFYKLLQVVAG